MKTFDALKTELRIPVEKHFLEGELNLPEHAKGVVLFAHGSGSSRHSPRNQFVANVIVAAGCGTLLFDLLTAQEEAEDEITAALRFDIDMLARRLVEVTRWFLHEPQSRDMALGYFGSSTGAAAALVAAADLGVDIEAVVSRGGRPDLAGHSLPLVTAPTLLIVGRNDEMVLNLNRQALTQLRCENQLQIIPGATHLFPEPGALQQVAALAADWFSDHLGRTHTG